MPGSGLPAAGDEIAGKYRIESVLGQGGMGAVFAARNVLTGKRVAIKWLLPEHAASTSRDRLLREAQIAASIDHPNVVDIYDVGEHQGGLFLVMEYLRGRNLADLLAERGRLDPEELITLLVPAMRGVHAAHLAGVVHRDLKPENIILSESDGHIVPKVVDFGVSKTVGTGGGVPHSSLTRTGALVGTPHFMALEQVDGTNLIDGRTDVYAFGVLLYRALTGHFPFDGSSLGEVILKIGTKDPVPMRVIRPELSPELDNVVLRALLRDRSRRFTDLDQLARALLPFAPGVRLRDTADTTGRFSQTARAGGHSVAPPSGPGIRISDTTPNLSLNGALPELISQRLMLGAAVSMQGMGARPTPLSPPASSARVAWGLAGFLIIGVLGGGFWFWSQKNGAGSANLPAQRGGIPSAKASVGDAVGTGSAGPTDLADTVSTQVSPDQQPAADPARGGAPQADSLQKSFEAAENDALSEQEQAAVPAAANRLKRAKSPPKAATVRSVKLIPGDRTKGLSVDEF